MQVSLVLSERRLHEGQNHLFCDNKISDFRNWLIEVCMSVDTGRVTISRFSSDTEEQKQVLQETVIFIRNKKAFDIRFLYIILWCNPGICG